MSGAILIYSKYSSHCKRLFDIIKNSPVNFAAVCSLKTFCLDNPKVRELVIGNSKIGIKMVPCVLIIFPDGVVEKYEGIAAESWAENLISKHRPAPPRIPQVTRVEEPEPEYSPRPPPAPRPVSKRPSRPVKRPPHRRPSKRPAPPPVEEEEYEDEGHTNIDDIEIEGEESEIEEESEPEDEEEAPPPRRQTPTAGPRGMPSGTSHGPAGGIRENNGKVNVASIMAQAQAMQRQRERIDKMPPSGQMPPRSGRRF